jgi:phosphate transport system permease protein
VDDRGVLSGPAGEEPTGQTVARSASAGVDLRGSPRRRRRVAVVTGLFFSAAALSVVVSALIVVSLVGKAVQFLSNVDLGSLWGSGWFPRQGLFDLKTVLAGSLIVTAVAMVVAAPLGLGAAIFLSEYAKPRVRRLLKPILEVLASIPSVVLGFFALNVLQPDIAKRLFGSSGAFSLLAAGIAVGILVIPLVASIAEDALHAVPNSLREAAAGIGARKRTTSLRIVFPAAVSGIMASLIVGVSRALGETMVVAIAAGATGSSAFTLNPLQPGQTLTAAMASLATGTDQVAGASQAFNSLFFLGLVLFVLTLGLNVLSERFVRRTRKRL